MEGFKQALTNMGLEINPDWIIEGGFEVVDGFNAFMKLYHSNNLPEIIFTVNDRAALGVYNAVRKVGLKIPDDIGILAYGFNETVQSFSPVLSIINQDPRKLGCSAVSMLLQEMENGVSDKNRKITIEEEFLWNNSIKRKLNR